MEKGLRKRYAGSMLGFSKKRFLITLGLSVVVWVISAVIQAYATFTKYMGTFSTGCQVTGYPIDVCSLRGPNISAVLIIAINIFFWFWVLHFAWSWFEKRGN